MNGKPEVRGLILAGGAGSRVRNQDKGLLDWHGKPMISHVIARLQSQVSELFISCNRNRAQYIRFGFPLLHDRRENFQGPLAGLESSIETCGTGYLIVVPCDTPFLPEDLVVRLLEPLVNREGTKPDIAYAHDGLREHYLCAAIRPGILATVSKQLDSGRRSVRAWFAQLSAIPVDFSDQPEAFRNINRISR